MATLSNNISGRIGDGQAQVLGNQTLDTAGQIELTKESRNYQEIDRLRDEKAKAIDETNVLLDGFEKDINGELFRDKQGLRQFARQTLKEEGINEDSFSKIQEMQTQLMQKVSLAKQQKDFAVTLQKQLNQSTADKYFDIEESRKRIEEFKALPILKRGEYDKELLVRNEPKYNAFAVPDVLFMPDNKTGADTPKFRANFEQALIHDPEVQEHYLRGLESPTKPWSNPQEYYTFIRMRNDAEYLDRAPKSGSGPVVRYNDYGDPNLDSAVQEHITNPKGQKYMYGTESAQMNAIVNISRNAKQEIYGEMSYMEQGSSEWQTAMVGEVTPMQLLIAPDGRKLLYAMKTEMVQIPPSKAQVEAAQMQGSNMYLPAEEIYKKLSKTEKQQKLIYIDITGDEENQKRRRPKLWDALNTANSQQSFTDAPVENIVNDVFDSDQNTNDSKSRSETIIEGL